MTTELARLQTDSRNWRRWGPYLSERAWATVREDYSADGDAWGYFPHDHARSKVYRWNEDGLVGISDRAQYLCFALALWNGKDPILKERLFGLTGPEGNHGEDVKEYYFYLDNTPTHSYMKMLYKYPQAEFPYRRLVEENGNRNRDKTMPEFELLDTGLFDGDRYFDVFTEYAKAAPNDILIQFTVVNRGPEAAPLHVLPTLWFRNVWAWQSEHSDHISTRPTLGIQPGKNVIQASHEWLGVYHLYADSAGAFLFTENETNTQRLYQTPNNTPYVKDAFHEYLINGDESAVNPNQVGTKAAAWYALTVGAGETRTIRLRLQKAADTAQTAPPSLSAPFADFDAVLSLRQREADEYYAALQPPGLDADLRQVQRQAFAGMLWSKQFYHYDVDRWLRGDPGQPLPPAERKQARNHEWFHLNTFDVLSMPDTWEYPWFAAWDLAFHCITLAMLDGDFAKQQLILLLREWYQHPNGQIPAYEWAFGDVNPPVFAWASWRVYKIDGKMHGKHDTAFLERVFHKLLLSFTWWVNRKDAAGRNVFQGGFLGLDNIGVFDRSAPLPTGEYLEQSDGTSWMAMFCLNMMAIALELALTNPVYEDIATKFFEHFMYIAAAMNNIGDVGISMWDAQDEFFYDVLHLPGDELLPLKVHSLVGLIPLLAVETIEPELLDKVPAFKGRLEWFLENRPDLAGLVSHWQVPGAGERRLLALVRGHRMKSLLKRALDPDEFLGAYGIRSVSKYHEAHPYSVRLGDQDYVVGYEPAESRTGLFGGNSNWRGPIWFPINYLLIEALQKFHHYYGDDFQVECPTGSGQLRTLDQIADMLSQRLIALFARNATQRRPFNGQDERLQTDPHWRDLILFHEYFHGDTGMGLGASHQTGWTGLVAKLIQQQGEQGSAD